METLYSGGLLFDGDQDRGADMGVLVNAGRIVKVAPSAEFGAYTGKRIDTTGMTLLPGLIDRHVHMCSTAHPEFANAILSRPLSELSLQALNMAQDTLRGGVTTVRDLGGIEYLEIKLRDMINAGSYLGPTMVCAGKSITMTGGHMFALSHEVDGVDAAIRAVRENIKAGADVIKVITTGGVATPNLDPMLAHLSAAEVAAVVSEAQRLERKAAAHAQGAPGIKNALDAGIDSIEHGFQLSEELIAQMLKQGTYLVPTLSAIAATLDFAEKGVPAFMVEKSKRFQEMQRKSFQAFIAAGGKVAMGTDCGTPFNHHGLNVRELAEMCELGMAPLDALCSATGNAADLLGLTDRGRIKEGWYADMLLVNGNAAADISCVSDLQQHVKVVKNGFVVEQALGPRLETPLQARFLHDDAPF